MRNLRPFVMILMSLGIGLAAMTVAAQWLRDRSVQQTRPVLVATHELAAGTRLERAMLEVVHWPQDALAAPALSRLEEAEGRVITSNLLRGEPLLLARLAASGETGGLSALLREGRRAVTVKVNEIVGVAGFALPGNFVDVMVHTVGVDEVNVGMSPESEVAVSVGAVPKFCAPGLLKVMVWIALGVTALEDSDAGPVPALLSAVTVKVYAWPLVSPETTMGEFA